MAKKAAKPEPTFEVRFIAPDISPERIPLRAVSDALSAVQDLASGRDPFETSHVPPDKAINLVDVRSGSAVYACVSRAPDDARLNLGRVRKLLAEETADPQEDDGLIAAFRPIQSLSEIAKSVGCRVEVALTGAHRNGPLFAVGRDDFQRLSSRLLLTGETTIAGTVQRVGGATEMRCLLRVPGRHRLLYCNIATKEVARRLGQHLYEQVAASGTAVWIHRSWRVYSFRIRDFSQPRLGDVNEALKELRNAGLSAWDAIDDPQKYIRGLRQ